MADQVKDGGADPAPVDPKKTPAVGNDIDLSGVAAALGQELTVKEKKPEAAKAQGGEDAKGKETDPKPDNDTDEHGRTRTSPPKDDPNPENDPDAAENAETVKELPEATKARVEKRIGKLTAQKKEAAELAETEKARADAAEAREAELKTQLAEAKAQGSGIRGQESGQSQLLAAETEADISAFEKRLDQLEEFIDEHIDEGYTADDPEKKSYTPAELRKMQRQIARQRQTLIPQAREALKQRQTAVEEAKKVYPDLFKAGTELKTKADALLRDYPELKAMPNVMIFIGDALAKAAERAAPAKKPAAEPKKEPAKIPSPSAPKPAPASPDEGKKKVDMNKITESGGSVDAIAQGISALGLG